MSEVSAVQCICHHNYEQSCPDYRNLDDHAFCCTGEANEMESSLGGEPAGPVPNAQCGTSGSPPPRLPTCLLRAELADVCTDLNRVEVDCKRAAGEQRPCRDTAEQSSQHYVLSLSPQKSLFWEQSCYLPVGMGRPPPRAAPNMRSKAAGLDAHISEQSFHLFSEMLCLPAAGCLVVFVIKVSSDGGSCWQ